MPRETRACLVIAWLALSTACGGEADARGPSPDADALSATELSGFSEADVTDAPHPFVLQDGVGAEDGDSADAFQAFVQAMLAVCDHLAACEGVPFTGGGCKLQLPDGCRDQGGFVTCVLTCADATCDDVNACLDACEVDSCG